MWDSTRRLECTSVCITLFFQVIDDCIICFRPTNISEKYRQFPFPTHRNAITDEYEVSKESLGVGINGKVLTCWQRETKRKCALKVNAHFNPNLDCNTFLFFESI